MRNRIVKNKNNLEKAKSEIFSEIASCLNNTNDENWNFVIERTERILHIAKQLKKIEETDSIIITDNMYQIKGVNVFQWLD